MRPPHTDPSLAAPRDGLHVCPACDRAFVVPVSVLEVLPDGRMPCVLACRNCDWHDAGAFGDDELEALDLALDAISGAMEDALEAMTRAAELARIDAFAAALAGDQILPEDF